MRNSRIPHIVKRRSLTDLKDVENPIKVTYQNLTASIKYNPSDGLFHGYWNIGGIKGKTASKTRTEKATTALMADSPTRH